MWGGKKGVILLVYVWTVVSFLFYYSPTVFRLSSQAYCRNALEASDVWIYKGICLFEFTCIAIIGDLRATIDIFRDKQRS